jgi:hypothetical protein
MLVVPTYVLLRNVESLLVSIRMDVLAEIRRAAVGLPSMTQAARQTGRVQVQDSTLRAERF